MQEPILRTVSELVSAALPRHRLPAMRGALLWASPWAFLLAFLLALLSALLLSLPAAWPPSAPVSPAPQAGQVSRAGKPVAVPDGLAPAPHTGSTSDRVALNMAAGEGIAGRPIARAFVTDRDTINGHRIADPAVRARIERIAAAVPAHLLAGNPRAAHIRYLAHAFGADDDAAISYGLFQEPAAALAFGCAMDDDLAGRCSLVELTVPQAAYEDAPGVRCEPIGVALGAPAYEPDRCEAAG